MATNQPHLSADSGNLFVIAAPSGTGKTTLVKALIDSLPKITVSISHTTRPIRPNERHGINYFFINANEFQQHVAHNDFLEHAIIFDHQYGTTRQSVEQTLQKGIDVILEIDWQGFRQVKQLIPDTIGIFILPPSLDDLRVRLIKRNQDHPDVIKKRLIDVRETVAHANEFDYVIINDDFSQALQDLKTIVGAVRLLYRRQAKRFNQMINQLSRPVEDSD